jgi:peptidoglycan/LPS O-acetylase OafA/YrhL
MRVSVLVANVLIVFVLFVLAIHIGAGVYQAYATIGVAAGHLPQSAQTVPDEVWRGVVEFWSSGIHPACMLAMIAIGALSWRSPRRWWAVAGLLFFVVALVATALYFAPQANALFVHRGAGLSSEQFIFQVRRWITLDRVRFLAGALSFLCFLKTLTMPVKGEAAQNAASTSLK